MHVKIHTGKSDKSRKNNSGDAYVFFLAQEEHYRSLEGCKSMPGGERIIVRGLDKQLYCLVIFLRAYSGDDRL